MPAVNFYFQLHQPLRIKKYRVFDIARDHNYFNDCSESNLNNKRVLSRVVKKCYLPASRLILGLLNRYPQFRVSFSFSGILLEQLEKNFPEVIDLFKRIVRTKQVEVLGETYYHSLAFLYSRDEFKKQVKLHQEKIKKLFNQKPKTFGNTELIYNNELAKTVENLGYAAVLAEGADKVLEWRSPNYIYKPEGTKKIRLLLRNYRLSDDISFRFSERYWTEFPLTAPKFASWIAASPGDVVNLFMDYETFGEHQWPETGIFEFLKRLPQEILKHKNCYFVTSLEAIKKLKPVASLDVPDFISWADIDRDTSAWLGNAMQRDAISKLYQLESEVLNSRDSSLIEDWRRLQTSDHFYYMCTKWFADGDVHKYFNPYNSPYDAFISFMNVYQDLNWRIKSAQRSKNNKK